MKDLAIALIQTDLHWEQPEANRAMLEEKLWQLDKPADVVVLPEMFTTGFTMNASALAEPMKLTTFRWMAHQAKRLEAAVVGSFIVVENGEYFNRLVWMKPDGQYHLYDKKHLFRMAREGEVYTAGKERLIVEWRGWKICPLICYDLRFPVWSRNAYDTIAKTLAYDCLIYLANWPQARIQAWSTLLQARAIENLCYTVGVNRVGIDDMGILYNGESAVYNGKGESILTAQKDDSGIYHTSLSAASLQRLRDKFPTYLDSDPFIFENQ